MVAHAYITSYYETPKRNIGIETPIFSIPGKKKKLNTKNHHQQKQEERQCSAFYRDCTYTNSVYAYFRPSFPPHSAVKGWRWKTGYF